MLSKSREHLSSAGETYFQHAAFAASVGLMAVGAGLACLIHALVPALCQRTCSTTVSLLQELFADRSRLPDVTEQASGAMTFVALLALAGFSACLMLVLGAGSGFAALVFALALLLPVTFLATNSELAPV